LDSKLSAKNASIIARALKTVKKEAEQTAIDLMATLPTETVTESVMRFSVASDPTSPMPVRAGYVYHWNPWEDNGKGGWIEITEEQERINQEHDARVKQMAQHMLRTTRLANRDPNRVAGVDAVDIDTNIPQVFDSVPIPTASPIEVDLDSTIAPTSVIDLTSTMFDVTELLDDDPNPQTNPLAYIQQAQLTAEIKAELLKQADEKWKNQSTENTKKLRDILAHWRKKERRSIKSKVNANPDDTVKKRVERLSHNMFYNVKQHRWKQLAEGTLPKRRESYKEYRAPLRDIKKTLHRERGGTFAQWVQELRHHADANPDDVDAYGKAIKSYELAKA
jgi:hypothetical protein